MRCRLPQSGDAIFLLDRHGHLLEANAVFCAMLGYTWKAATALTIFDIVEDEREIVQASLGRILGQSLVFVGERKFRHRSKAPLDVEVVAAAVELKGELAIKMVARDIGARKLAEAEQDRLREAVTHAASQWRHTFDAIASPILVLDGELRILRLNAAARDYLQSDFGTLLHSRLPTVPALWLNAGTLASAALLRQEPQELRACDSQGRHMQVIATPRDGNHVVLLIHDVTDLHDLQESLRHSEMMSAMGALVAGVAHEVRNPLFSISALVETLELKFGFGPEQATYIDRLRGELDRLNRLMNDLLTYGRATAREKSAGDLVPLVHTALDLNGQLLRQRQVGVSFNFAGTTTTYCDEGRLVDALRNLIENGAHHSPAGSAIEIALSQQAGIIALSVRDHGPGFSGEALERAFEPFYSRRNGGTGLGLSIVERVALDHGGSVKAENHPGGGGMVTLTLPWQAG
ncbi:MAG: PAS domain-containing sensor histidine kinase [Acidobacteriaceae bacterium]